MFNLKFTIMRKRIIFSLMALMMAAFTYAYDFTAECSSGQTLAYTIVSAGDLTCEVTEPDAMPEGDVVIPASVVNTGDSKTYTVIGIGNRAFYNATGLTSVTFPTAATFTYIGKYDSYKYCFNGCTGLTGKLVIPDNVTEIGCSTFGYTKYSEIQFGTGVTKIGSSAFYRCPNLKHVVLPDDVTWVGSTAFGSCDNLVFIQLGSKIATLSGDFLHYNTKLDTVIIKTVTPPSPSSPIYETVTKNAILYVPAGSVEAYKAATYWKAFKFIYAEGTPVTRVTLTVMNNVSDYINDGCRVYADGTEVRQSTVSVKYVSGTSAHIVLNPKRYWTVDSVLLNGVNVLPQFTNNEANLTLTEDATLRVEWKQDHPYDFTEKVKTGQTLCFQIMDPVNHKVKIVNQSGGRSVGGYTSYGYIHKETEGYYAGKWREGNDLDPTGDLVIPAEIIHEGVTYTIEEIDTMAFSYSNITGLSLPEGIKKLRAGAFYESYDLDGNVCIPQSCDSIEEWSFRDCYRIKSMSLGGVKMITGYLLYDNNYITHMQVPAATTKIGSYAFISMYQLKSLEIGENVTRVANSAFAYNTSHLTTVTCYATTPPEIKSSDDQDYEDSEWYNFNASGATLYVPKSVGSTVLEAYKTHKCWKLFGTIAELPDQYTITTAVKTLGTGDVFGGGRYESGTDTVLTAVPALYYEFIKWSDGNTDNPRHITVTGDATYTAEFGPRYSKVGDILEMTDNGKPVRFEVISIAPNEVKLVTNGNRYREMASDWTIPSSITDYWGATFKLTRLGEYCMYDNNGIDTLRIPEGVRVVESSALYNSNFRKWYFPSTIDSIYGNNATYCYNLQDIRFAGTDNLRYVDFYALTAYSGYAIKSQAANNAFCIRDGVALFYKGTAPQIFEVPEGVKVIAKNATSYAGVSSVKYVRLPSTLKVINAGAFNNLPSACTTVYLAASTPPAAGTGLFSYESSKKVVVPCGTDLTEYKADAYWSTLDTIVNGSQFVATVEKVNNCGTYEIKEPTCGTIRIVAKPNTYYVVDEWGTGAKDVDSIDVVLTSDSTISLKFKYESYTVRFLDWDGSEVYPSQKIQRYQNVDPIPELPNNRTGYTSKYWTRSDGYSVTANITQNVDFTVYYSPNQYTITFKNWDGGTLDTHTQYYDTYVNYYGSTPTRPENDTCKYFFKEWSPEFISGTTKVTGDMTFTAMFTKEYKSYTVTFKNWNGDELDKQEGLHLGDVLTYKGETPTKPSTAEYVYNFTGWNNGFIDGVTKVSKDISSYVAQFEQKDREYTISFVNYDDAPLWSGQFKYNVTPTYGGDTPTRPANETYTYTFKEWTPEIVKVTEDATYKAMYTATFIDYTVTFLNYDDSEIAQLKEKHYGDVIEFTTIPTRAADEQYVYTFDKWDPAFESGVTTVTGNMSFKATYTSKLQTYTVTFLEKEGGAKLDEAIVKYGSDATSVAPDITAITPADKRFDKWSQDITFVKGNMTVWPLWKDKVYLVQFIDPLDNDKVIEEYENVPFGGKVAPPTAPVHAGYNFVGWDSDAYKNVTDDLIIKAVYEEITALNNVELETQATKFIENGQLFIRHKGKIYDANGAKVK